jgi:ribonuclease HII
MFMAKTKYEQTIIYDASIIAKVYSSRSLLELKQFIHNYYQNGNILFSSDIIAKKKRLTS